VHLSKKLLAGAAAASVVALPATPALAKTNITLSGSTSVAPLAEQLKSAYLKTSAGRKVSIRILQGGSDVGVSQAKKGSVTFGMVSRDPIANDKGLSFVRIARDGVCIITNPSNPLSNLSQSAVQQIFTGRVRSWSQVPGAKATGSIKIFSRTAASGTADAFKNIFLGPSLNIVGNAQQLGSNGLVRQNVANDPNGIGFVDFKFVQGVAPAAYNGVACNLRNAKSGAYKGVRNFWFVYRTKKAPKGESAKFLSWVRGNATAKKIIGSGYILP
jgi:phosphate transport system substrate-binding protein